jgi:hypothetical protein
MKNYLLIIVALFLIQTAQAQLSFRPQAGFNASSLTEDFEGDDFEDKWGFQFGADLQIGNRLYFQPGIFWESATNELKQEIKDDNNKFTVNRIRIPFMIGYKFFGETTDRLLDIRAFTGPNAAFVVDKDLGDDALFQDNDFKDSVWGWSVGMGVDLAFLFVDVGYQFGLSEVFESATSDARNNLFYANAGLRIGF